MLDAFFALPARGQSKRGNRPYKQIGTLRQSALAQLMQLGVVCPKATIFMSQHLRLSVLLLSVLLPWAAALPQTASSAQDGVPKSKSQSAKWTEADERTLLAKAEQGNASSQMWAGHCV